MRLRCPTCRRAMPMPPMTLREAVRVVSDLEERGVRIATHDGAAVSFTGARRLTRHEQAAVRQLVRALAVPK